MTGGALPAQQHVGRERDLRQRHPMIQLGVILADQLGVRRPAGPELAHRVGHGDAARELSPRPPLQHWLRHTVTITVTADIACESELREKPLHLGDLGALRVDDRLRQDESFGVLTVGQLRLGHVDRALVVQDHLLEVEA